MKGVNKIVEEILLIAIVILLIIALFFMFNNWFSKNQNPELQGVIVKECVIDKNSKSIKLRIRNVLDKEILNTNIELYNGNNMEKISSVLLKDIKPNEVKTILFPINDTSKISENIHVEFSGNYIPSKDINCKIIG